MKKQADYRENLRQLREDIDWKMLGSHMQEVRKQSKFTQAQMAERMGISPNYYSGYESGDKHINLTRLIQFIVITQVQPDYLLRGTHPNYPAELNTPVCVSEQRIKIEHILDQCSKETLDILIVLAQALLEHQGRK